MFAFDSEDNYHEQEAEYFDTSQMSSDLADEVVDTRFRLISEKKNSRPTSNSKEESKEPS